MKLDPAKLRSLAKSCHPKGQGRLEERADAVDFLIREGHPELAEALIQGKHLEQQRKRR